MATKNCICKCEGCGSLFKPKKADRLRFCSRDCAFKNIYLIRNNPIKKEKEALRRIAKANHTKIKQIFILKEVAALIRIKNKNKKQYGTLNTKTYNCCKVCFKLFVFTIKMGRHQVYCDSCTKKKKQHNARIDKARRRAIERGVYAERINPMYVFERDKWVCHICKKKTNKFFRGTDKSKAPELDHIISLADGGTHTYKNVACSCRKCNGLKGRNSYGQLFIF